MFHVCVCYAVLSVPWSLVITCWEKDDLLALLCVVFSCVLTLSNIILIHIRLRVRLVSLIMFKPSSNFDKLGVFHAIKHLCVLIHIGTKDEVGAPFNRFKPFSIFFNWPFKGGASFVDHFYLCFVSVFVILSCLFLTSLWSPAGKGLTSWLSCVLCFPVFLSLSHMVS